MAIRLIKKGGITKIKLKSRKATSVLSERVERDPHTQLMDRLKDPPKNPPSYYDSMFMSVYKLSSGYDVLVPWWLMASYSYYVMGTPMLTDGMFDTITGLMKDNWELIDHPHKHLISEENLAAGTLFNLKGSEYPLRTLGALQAVIYG